MKVPRSPIGGLVFFISSFTVLIASVLVWSAVRSSNNLWLDNIQRRLVVLSTILARDADTAELAEFTAPEDADKPLYMDFKRRLDIFAHEYDIKYAYFARKTDEGMLQFIVDNDFDITTEVGINTEPIHANQALQQAFSGKTSVLGLGDYVEQNEGLLSAFAPVYDSHQQIVAIAGVDISDEEIMLIKRRNTLISVLLLTSATLSIASGFVHFRMYQRKARQAEAANASKSAFLSGMSHEMRTPLNAIIGLSELSLGDSGVEGEVRENIEKVYTSGVTLLGIINDILDISKIESGRFEFVPVNYDVPSLINDTIALNIIRIIDKPIQFTLNASENIPSRLFGDDLRIKQVFNNILSNAFKYTREGSVTWNISAEKDGEWYWLVSSISDTGIGIRKEDKDKLFQSYSQLDAKANRKIEGTGLGLAITKRMVELMGGSITVDSEYGKGTTFTVRIKQGFITDVPIGKEVTDSLQKFHYINEKQERHTKLVRIRLPYARVLVVDDVSTNLDVARGMLKPYGMRIDCVTSGTAAIQLVRDDVKFNAIFMDHMMPEMDGIEAVRIIREEIGTEYAKTVPIIALTANAIRGNEEMFLQNGFQAFISKPIDVNELDAVIRQWVRDKELEKNLPDGTCSENTAQPENCVVDRLTENKYEGDTAASAVFGGKLINGVNLAKALSRFGGEEKSLVKVLRSYVVETPGLLNGLPGMASENLEQYAVTIHGIKGSSRGICAEKAGRMAEDLEHAAKAGDIAYVQANTPPFLALAENLVTGINGLLRDLENEKPKPPKESPDTELLAELRQGCLEFDVDKVDATISELEKYQYMYQADLIIWLREQAALMDFKGMANRLQAI